MFTNQLWNEVVLLEPADQVLEHGRDGGLKNGASGNKMINDSNQSNQTFLIQYTLRSGANIITHLTRFGYVIQVLMILCRVNVTWGSLLTMLRNGGKPSWGRERKKTERIGDGFLLLVHDGLIQQCKHDFLSSKISPTQSDLSNISHWDDYFFIAENFVNSSY